MLTMEGLADAIPADAPGVQADVLPILWGLVEEIQNSTLDEGKIGLVIGLYNPKDKGGRVRQPRSLCPLMCGRLP